MKINIVYQHGSFNFSQNYSLKTKEQTTFFNQNIEPLQLLNQNIINHHKKRYKYIHIS